MPDSRDSIQLEAAGTLTTGVKDRYQAGHNFDITSVSAVVGTAPTGGPLTLQVRVDTVVAATLSIAAGATEGTVTPASPVAVTAGQTVDVNVTVVGSTVAGADLDVTVGTAAR